MSKRAKYNGPDKQEGPVLLQRGVWVSPMSIGIVAFNELQSAGLFSDVETDKAAAKYNGRRKDR